MDSKLSGPTDAKATTQSGYRLPLLGELRRPATRIVVDQNRSLTRKPVLAVAYNHSQRAKRFAESMLNALERNGIRAHLIWADILEEQNHEQQNHEQQSQEKQGININALMDEQVNIIVSNGLVAKTICTFTVFCGDRSAVNDARYQALCAVSDLIYLGDHPDQLTEHLAVAFCASIGRI